VVSVLMLRYDPVTKTGLARLREGRAARTTRLSPHAVAEYDSRGRLLTLFVTDLEPDTAEFLRTAEEDTLLRVIRALAPSEPRSKQRRSLAETRDGATLDGTRNRRHRDMKEGEMIGEIAVVPQVEGPAREVVAKAIGEIEAQGLHYRVGPTGTSVEGELTAILDAVRAIESRLRADGIGRALIEVRLQLEPHEETLEHQVEGLASPAA
jgi:uncharacterized protein YqgV (UPF0045/DUF77 family)